MEFGNTKINDAKEWLLQVNAANIGQKARRPAVPEWESSRPPRTRFKILVRRRPLVPAHTWRYADDQCQRTYQGLQQIVAAPAKVPGRRHR